MARRYYDEEEDIRYTADSPRARGREEYLTETKPERTYEIGYEEGKNAAEEAAARAADNLKEESATGAAAYTPTTGTGATSAKPASVTAAQTETKELLSEDYLRKLANGEKFTYDVAKDPTFLSLLARARKEGDLAAKDSIARTTALTGGHGNTYAEQVAQRAAQAQLDAVYDRVPELEAAAYERYRDERSDLRDMYSLLASKEAAAKEEAWREKEWDLTLERYRVADEQWAAGHNLDVERFLEDKYEFQESLKLQWADMGLKEKEYALDKWYKEQGIQLSKAELAEKARQFDEEMNLSYYKEQNDNAYRYAALEQDNNQFYANLNNKTEAAGILTLKSQSDVDKAVAGLVDILDNVYLDKNQRTEQAAIYLSLYGDQGKMIGALAEKAIEKRDAQAKKTNNRMSGQRM